MRRVWLWLPPLVYMAVIFTISAQSDPLPAVTQRVWDKALHLVEYGVLSLLFCRALRGEGLAPLRVALFSVLLASAYGATDETHQIFVPNRQAGADDWLADTSGAATAAALFNTVSRRRHPLRRSPPVRSDRLTAPAVRVERPSVPGDR